ncbi:MAG TPA: hypothetical protein VKU39_21690, partial [Streptosporangiaceae bacterium]|nr:hypothetical protein [Streptosporangiaceae bacterium]
MTKQIKKKLAVAVGATAVLAAGSMLAVTAATATAAPAAVAQARAAQTAITASAWQIVKEFHGAKVEVSALAGVPGGEPLVFVGNNSPEAFERTGSGWTQMPFPAGYFQVDVAAASAPGNVWAFAEYITRGETQYRALRWDGRSWSVKA